MESQVPLASLLPVLPAEMAGQIKEIVGDPEQATVHRKTSVDSKAKPLDPQAREVLQYVSTRDIDREAEILDPDGCILTEFKKAPQVLWGHDYSQPPIGSDRVIEADGYGIRAITEYAKTDMGNDVWLLRRDGHLNTSSVGFVPMTTTRKGDDGWATLTKKLAAKWDMGIEKFEKVNSIVSKWLLLEHSDVSVPANINARTIAVGPDEEGKQLAALLASGAIKTKSICESLAKSIKDLQPTEVVGFSEDDGLPDSGKPFENEHACRLVEPGKFDADSFRRYSRDSDGKKYHVIAGKLKGQAEMTEQAHRFPKDVWTAAQAKGHCKKSGGISFEPAKESQPVAIRVIERPRIIQVLDPQQIERRARVCILQIQGRLE